MTIRKRLRLLWAVLAQSSWREYTCECGNTQLVFGEMWNDPTICITCETKSFEAWERAYHARQQAREQKEIA